MTVQTCKNSSYLHGFLAGLKPDTRLTVYLCQYQLVSYKRASQFFLDIFGLEVSPGSICTFQENAYDQLASTEQAIVDALKNAPIAGADETGMRVAGSLWWMHVLRSEKWTLYHLDPSKGHSAIESMGILLTFAGIRKKP